MRQELRSGRLSGYGHLSERESDYFDDVAETLGRLAEQELEEAE